MSTVPAVVAALVALAESTFSSDDFQVIDGPATTETVLKQRIFAVADTEIVSPTAFDSLGAMGME
jgi:hypothetical protein